MGNKKAELLAVIKKDLTVPELVTFYQQHNIVFERVDLFRDFCISLTKIIDTTYLGDDITPPDQQLKHFKWCWKKVIDDFAKENIHIQPKGLHYRYFAKHFKDMYYDMNDKHIRGKAMIQFWLNTFSYLTPKRHIDLNVLISLYNLMNKNLTIQ